MSSSGVTVRELIRCQAASVEAPAEDRVIVEEPLELRCGGETLALTMRTPGDDQRLVAGFLFAEGMIRSLQDLSAIVHCGRPGEEGFGNVVEITPSPGIDLDPEAHRAVRRGGLTSSACGVCGRRTIDDLVARVGPLPLGPLLPWERITEATARLSAQQRRFAHTGGSHAAAALDLAGEVLCAYEDVGRHNAVDKVIGALLYSGRLPADPPPLLVVSGRAGFEIVQKAAAARIPVVVCVSAPSSLAVDLARRANLTLAAFARGDRFNLYSAPERLSGLTPQGAHVAG